MRLKSIIAILVILFLSVKGECMSIFLRFPKDIVPYEDLGSYMEYTVEEDVIIRTICSFGSVRSITDYKIKEENENNHKNYFITFFLNQKLDEKINSDINLTKWGIRLNLRINNIGEEDKIFYKDKKGVYEIKKGTKESWKKYLINNVIEKYKSKLSQKEINEILDDI